MNIPFVRFVDRNVGIPLCRLLAVFAGRARQREVPQPEQVARIAILKFVGLGNLVLASPTLASLRQRFPGAHITFITLAANRRLLETNADVDEVVYFDAGCLCSVGLSAWRLLWHLRRGGYDAMVDREPYSRFTALMAGLSGIGWRAGFDAPGHARGQMFTLPVAYTNDMHMVEAFHTLAERLGCPRPETLDLTPLSWSLADEAAAEIFLMQHGADGERPLVGMHVGTGDNATVRRWPAARFGQLADALIEEYGVQVVFTGSPKEAPLVQAAVDTMRQPAINSAGHLSIPQLACAVSRCSLFVSGDTGPLHMAAALRVPILGLYGPNTPALYGPWGDSHAVIYHQLPCSPCISNLNDKLTKCPHGQCIQSITVAEVLEQIRARHSAFLRPQILLDDEVEEAVS